MSKVKSILAFLIGVILLFAIIWGLTELIANIFNIEDSDGKRLIRWALIFFFVILGSVIRVFFPNLDKDEN